jgi:hypothetical protein
MPIVPDVVFLSHVSVTVSVAFFERFKNSETSVKPMALFTGTVYNL